MSVVVPPGYPPGNAWRPAFLCEYVHGDEFGTGAALPGDPAGVDLEVGEALVEVPRKRVLVGGG